MYKVMLVDDEEEVRSAIERRIDWESIGFRVVATAENGEEALEKAEQCVPDVVMSDIHMPFMDGLTFCRKLKELMPETKIVIFSGYDEFEYAKEAIKLEAEEYILKPIDAQELNQVFVRIKDRLDEELAKRRDIERLETYYKESLPILKEQYLISLLEGRLTKSEIQQFVQNQEFLMESAFYVVCVLEADIRKDEDMKNSKMNKELISVSVQQLAKEELDKNGISYRILNYLGVIVIIGFLKSTTEYMPLQNEMNQICRLCDKMLGVQVSAGIGNIYGNVRDLGYSYAEAKDAMAYRFVLNENQAISIKDVEPNISEEPFIDDSLLREVVKQIKVGEEESLKNSIDELIREMKKNFVSPFQLQLFFVEFYAELMKLARAYQLNQDMLVQMNINIGNEIHQFATLEALGDWITNTCMQLRSFIRKERKDTTRLITEKAIQYIQENYQDSNLSVDKVCSHLGVSPTYFSSLFKKETEMSFVAYLTKVRMEEAVRLLEETQEKSYVIAGMVGYEEPNYFSYVFKKYYGVSPSKYRQNR